MRQRALAWLFVAALAPLLVFAGRNEKSLTYGDWSVFLSDDKKDLIAATGQDHDKFLAYRCFTDQKKCAHVLVTATTCEDGVSYPVLVNATAGSLVVSCLCSENNGTYELLPSDWDRFHRLLTESSGYIGFAVPLASGQFKVVRFSLEGVKDALETAEVGVTQESVMRGERADTGAAFTELRRAEETARDILNVATAWEAFAADHNTYLPSERGVDLPSRGKGPGNEIRWSNYTEIRHAELRRALVPTYIRELPSLDGWGKPLQFAVHVQGKQGLDYVIRSTGSDGVVANGGRYYPSPTSSFASDIVFSEGEFKVLPRHLIPLLDVGVPVAYRDQ